MATDNKVIIKRINDWLECYQNKDNGFYNATELLRQYNEHYPNEQKLMKDFLRNKNTQNYIGSVLNDDDSFPKIFGKIDNEKDTLSYVKKGRKSKNTQVSDNQVWDNSPRPDNQQVTEMSDTLLYMKKGRTLKNGTQIPNTYYFAPMLFSKFGTWLSSDLERDIHKVLWNNILEYRKDVTKLMPEFTDAIKDFQCDGNLYVKIHAMLQKAIFGKYQPEGQPLNKANENELFRYKQLQSEIMTLIKYDIIKDYNGLRVHIKGYYR